MDENQLYLRKLKNIIDVLKQLFKDIHAAGTSYTYLKLIFMDKDTGKCINVPDGIDKNMIEKAIGREVSMGYYRIKIGKKLPKISK